MPKKSRKLIKRKTGIPGLDEVTLGGLPAHNATLIMGTPGAGKTILCLQVIANSIKRGKGGVFVTFEESSDQIHHDAYSFDWAESLEDRARFRVIDARTQADVMGRGDFDLDGLTALIDQSVSETDADWVVLDGIDHLLSLHSDLPPTGHIGKLAQWCQKRGVSLLVTAKSLADESYQPMHLEGAEFLLSCIISLSAALHGTRLNRRFRIIKYRGTAHTTNELPMVIDNGGLHLPFTDQKERPPTTGLARNTRCSTGITRLDDILAGGLLRGSTTLISGQPGTSKTTLSASIADAAARRGERVLYVSFDEEAERFVNNLTSVGLNLSPHITSGQIRLNMRLAWQHLVEEHYIAIHRILHEFKPDWLIVDPISALIKSTSVERAHISIERLLGEARALGLSIVLTSLTTSDTPENEATLSHASTLADSWISLSYNNRGGERNRALSIVKSRGTAHTNQVRELTISSDGLDLTDVYQFGTEVLMGTARLQKQMQESRKRLREQRELDYQQKVLQHKLDMARHQTSLARAEQERLLEQLELSKQAGENETDEIAEYHDFVRESRSPQTPARKSGNPSRRSRKAGTNRGHGK